MRDDSTISLWETYESEKNSNIPELTEKLDTPFVVTHNGLDLFGHILKNLPGFFLSWLFQCFDFPNLVKATHIHCSEYQKKKKLEYESQKNNTKYIASSQKDSNQHETKKIQHFQ